MNRSKTYKTLFYSLLIFSLSFEANSIEKCKWNNKEGVPCITVSKTPNTSFYSEKGIKKTIITKKDIIDSGAVDVNDAMKLVNGIDIFQSGTKGQTTSIFTRGSESNHTLVLLNGIAINDQSVTDGLHDFGQDFIQNIQQIEVYKGSNGSHFGPSAIAGAVNFITDIDYVNSYSISGFNLKNYSLNNNYTKITNNDWHFNIKGAANSSDTKSAIAGGKESDGVKNYQLSFDGVKWFNDNAKFKTSLYSRQTKADYDGSSTDESGYVSDNKMYAFQSSFEHKKEDTLSDLKLHYHNYDRKYDNSGYLDEYYSQAIVARGEREIKKNEKLSFGYGAEYKYDWGNFENRGSYTASTKGHIKNFGTFANSAYKLNENQIFSIFLRADDHSTTEFNDSYKLNFLQNFGDLNLNISHSTGLRNPTLYELYGTDNYGIKGNKNLDPEKSKTNELNLDYNISNNLTLKTSLYKTEIYDRIESNAAYTQHENLKTNINQEGIENEIALTNKFRSFSVFSNFSKSRKNNGQAQNRRPDLSYGAKYRSKIFDNYIDDLNINLAYKHTGKYTDWDGSANTIQKSTDLVDLNLNKGFLEMFYL